MRSTKKSRVRLRRQAALLGLSPRRTVAIARRYLGCGLREIFPEAALELTAITPWNGRDRSAGYRVEVVAHLPAGRSEVDVTDRTMRLGYAESQMAVALLSLCRRVWIAQIQVYHVHAGESSCVAILWVDTLRFPRWRRA
jgi:hypothetical protein